MRGLVMCDFADALLRGDERRRCVVLGKERQWPGDAVLGMLNEWAVVSFRLWVRCIVRLTLFLLRAGWRRLHHPAKHARRGCWLEQRRCDGGIGGGKIVCHLLR